MRCCRTALIRQLTEAAKGQRVNRHTQQTRWQPRLTRLHALKPSNCDISSMYIEHTAWLWTLTRLLAFPQAGATPTTKRGSCWLQPRACEQTKALLAASFTMHQEPQSFGVHLSEPSHLADSPARRPSGPDHVLPASGRA